ncbi:MAG: hypothetical protein ACI8R9_001454 [Paraglaciecola sp.]
MFGSSRIFRYSNQSWYARQIVENLLFQAFSGKNSGYISNLTTIEFICSMAFFTFIAMLCGYDSLSPMTACKIDKKQQQCRYDPNPDD